MKWLLSMLAAFLLLTTALVTVVRRHDSGWIAYTSHGTSGDRAIFLMTGDGRAQRRLTPFDICGSNPRWSPDGRSLALLSDCITRNNLLVWGGGSLRQGLGHIISAEWSPDGSRLLVTSGADELTIVTPDDGPLQLLADGYFYAQWSPDGEWIYALREAEEDGLSLERIHSQTGAIEPVLRAGFVSPLSWAPDMTQFVVALENELILVEPDGGARNPLSIDASLILEPRWSPDGEWIAFFGGESRPTLAVYRVRPDGRDLERISPQAGSSGELQWSPDSARLIFHANDDNSSSIFHMRADGSSLENLTPGPSNNYSPQYAPQTGLAWHPALMILVGLGILALSLVGKIRR